MRIVTQGSVWSAWGAVLLLGLSLFLAVDAMIPPKLRVESEPTKFLVGDALDQLQQIAQKPHPIGSVEHERVKNYLISRIKELGYTVETQKTLIPVSLTAYLKRGQKVKQDSTVLAEKMKLAYVENLLVRIKGKSSSTAVMIAGHYDSVVGGPGAGDAGSVVASMLEILRIFSLEKELENDVIFLFTDGEEDGLLGAKAFTDYHPWAKDVKIALNFEARGAGGISYLFETSEQNGWLIEQFADNAPFPRTSSMAYDVYKLMPNNTDFTIFQRAGMKGLSFAFIGKHTSYHTELDNIDQLDRRTFQHQGNYMLSMLKHFAKMPLQNVKVATQNRVFFNFIGDQVIHYQTQWTPYIATTVLIVFVVLLLIGSIARMLNAGMILVYAFALGIVGVVTVAVCHFLWKGILMTHSMYAYMPHGDTYNSDVYIVAFGVLATAIFALFYKLIHRQANHLNIMGGAMLWWILGMCATSYHLSPIKLPFLNITTPELELYGSSYVFTLPLICALLVWGFLIIRGRAKKYTFADALIVGALSIPIIYLMFPLIYLFQLALTIQVVGFLMLLVILTLGLLTPYFKMLLDGFKWTTPFFLLLVSTLLLFYASFTASFSETRKKANSILYAQDLDKGEALWASYDKKLDEFTKQFVTGEPQKDSLKRFVIQRPKRPFLTKKADSLANLAVPKLTMLSDSIADNQHFITADLQSLRNAERMHLFFEKGNGIMQVKWADSLVYQKDSTQYEELRYIDLFALPQEGAKLEFVTQDESVSLRLVEIKYGLDEVWNSTFKKRKPYMMMSPIKRAAMNNVVMLHKTFVLGTKNEEVTE